MEATWRPSSSKANKIKAFKEHFSIKASAPTPVWDQDPGDVPSSCPGGTRLTPLLAPLLAPFLQALAASTPPPPQLCRFFSNTDKYPQSCPLTGQMRPSSGGQQKCPLSSVLPASLSVGQTKQCAPKKKRFFYCSTKVENVFDEVGKMSQLWSHRRPQGVLPLDNWNKTPQRGQRVH